MWRNACLLAIFIFASTFAWKGRAEYLLQGVESFAVRVKCDIRGDALPNHLQETDIKRDAVKRLQDAGVGIACQEKDGRALDTPCLCIDVTVYPASKSDDVIAQIKVRVSEFARLTRIPKQIVSAVTWTRGSLGIYSKKTATECIRETIDEFLDAFVEKYREANPEIGTKKSDDK